MYSVVLKNALRLLAVLVNLFGSISVHIKISSNPWNPLDQFSVPGDQEEML